MATLNDIRRYNHQREDSALVLDDSNTKPWVSMVGGVVSSTTATYTSGDAGVLNIDTDGYLLCKLKSNINLHGDFEVNVSAFDDRGANPQDAFVYTDNSNVNTSTAFSKISFHASLICPSSVVLCPMAIRSTYLPLRVVWVRYTFPV